MNHSLFEQFSDLYFAADQDVEQLIQTHTLADKTGFFIIHYEIDFVFNVEMQS